MQDTSIAWCHDTLNVWIGCDKVSAGCRNCYAEQDTPTRVHRAAGRELWGREAERYETKSWPAHLRASARGAALERRRVFAQSLSDTFEDRPDLADVRARFFRAIDAWLPRACDFLLLTKRPENVLRMVPPSWLERWPGHVWAGCTVENQEAAEQRIPHLIKIPAPVLFLSCEPLLGPVDLTEWIADGAQDRAAAAERRGGEWFDAPDTCGNIDWVIIGGESGSRARPFDLAWARWLVAQCRAAGVAPFVKQLGANPHQSGEDAQRFGSIQALHDSHGGDPAEWTEDLRVREFPS